jgi:ketosteroid isomerase-like protein
MPARERTRQADVRYARGAGAGRRVSSLAALACGAAAPSLYKAALRALLRRNIARLLAGDLRPMLRLYAEDIHFVFPGESSWSADLRDKRELERWQRRFLAVGLQLVPREILISGPPWRTIVAVHFDDHLRTGAGELVYENTGVIYCTAVWGKLTSITVYEDTQKVARLDEHLERAAAPVG